MQRRWFGAVLVTCLVLAMLVVVPTAEAGNPVQEFLETVVQPMLISMTRTLDSIQIQGSNLSGKIEEVKFAVVGSPKVIPFSTTFVTHTNDSETRNLDGAAGVETKKIRRYTITVHATSLSAAPPATDKIEIFSAVLNGDVPEQVLISRTDPSGRESFAVFERPFSGTNTFIRVTRGADGLGDRSIHASGWIELTP
jgi:hypothetical protein